MAKTFEVGDLVWAKMKGYPAWPGKVVEIPENKKMDKKFKHYVYFFGSKNHAVVPTEMMWSYEENKDKYLVQSRPSHLFQESIDEIEAYISSNKSPLNLDLTSPVKSPSSPVKPVPESPTEDKITKSDRKRTSSAELSSPPIPLKNRILDRDFTAALSSADKKPMSSEKISSPVVDKMEIRVDNQKIITPEKIKSPTSLTATVPLAETNINQDFVAEPSIDKTASVFSFPIVVKKVGLVGTGDLGNIILDGLCSAGLEVHVWNKNIAKSKEHSKSSATSSVIKSSNASEVVQSCDVTFICAEDIPDIKNLAFGKSGLLHGISSKKSLINLSTVDIETTQVLDDAINLREGRYLEAPIVGSRRISTGNDVMILAAGDKSIFDECANIFKYISKHVFYLGDVGSACKMKLVLDGLVGTTLAGLAESLALATKVGLDPTELLTVLAASPVASTFVKEMGSDMVKSRLTEVNHCKLSDMQQHLRMMINMSEAVDQPLHVTSAVSELFKKAKAKGYADSDMVAVFRATDL